MSVSTVTLQERDTIRTISHIWGQGVHLINHPSQTSRIRVSVHIIVGNAPLQYWLEGRGVLLSHIQFILYEPSFYIGSHSPTPI